MLAGSTVRLHGLNKNTFLNDMIGVCKSWHSASNRWDVELENGEMVRLKPRNLELQKQGTCLEDSGVRKGCMVRIQGLQHQVELNGEIGKCVRWHATTGRWDVEMLVPNQAKGIGIGQIVSLRPANIDPQYMLPTNNGWRGKTVHSWMFGDEQEDVEGNAPAPSRMITVHVTPVGLGEKLVCTNMAGEEVAVVMDSFRQATLGEVKSAVAAASCCNACDVQLLTEDGHPLNGMSCWTLAEANCRR